MHSRITIILILLQVSGIFSGDLTLQCSYRIIADSYSCYLDEFIYSNTSRIIAIEGNHHDGKTDDDVRTVFLSGFSGFLYTVPKEIFIKFKKIEEFAAPGLVFLQEIKVLENCDELKEFEAVAVYQMEADSFKNCLKLENLHIIESPYFILPENIVIPSLTSLMVIYGNTTQLSDKTFNGLRNLRTLDLSENPIGRIENGAFNNLINLEILRLTMSNLTYLPNNLLEPVKNLKELNLLNFLSDNKLSVEFLQYVKQLRSLELLQMPGALDGNIPMDFLDNLVNLRVLHLQNNAIKCDFKECFNFSNLKELTSLNLASNEVQDIDENTFKNLYFLEKLYLNDNKIEVLRGNSFKNMKILDTLNLANNLIVSVDKNSFEGLIRLENLNLSNNRILEIENTTLTGLRSLVKLDLKGNKISVVHTNTFRVLGKLTTLDLSYNEIQNLEDLAFNRLNSLQTLNLDGNLLTTIPDFYYINLDTTIYLRNNLIINVLDSRFVQNIIHLENNLIQEIGPITFRPLGNRPKEVYLTNNQIISVHPRAFNDFKGNHKFDFEGNRCIHKIINVNPWDFENFMSSMEGCFLNAMSSEVTITCKMDIINTYTCTAELVTFSDPKDFKVQVDHLPIMTDLSVARLSFKDSKFPEIPPVVFERFSKLKRLDVSFVGLNTLNPINNCENLEALGLSNNDITHLSGDVFQNCQKLKSIDLTNNKISTLGDTVFQNLPKFKTLYLDYNNLTEIKREFFKQPSIGYLNLANNKIDSVQRGSFDDILDYFPTIDLSGNVCIEKKFVMPDRVSFHNDLENCYLNSGSGFLKIGFSVVLPVVLATFGVVKY